MAWVPSVRGTASLLIIVPYYGTKWPLTARCRRALLVQEGRSRVPLCGKTGAGMDFDWTADQLAFRQSVENFLARELPADWESIARRSPGSKELTDFSRQFCPKLA